MPLSDVPLRNLKPREKPYKVGHFDGLYVTVNPTGSRLWHMKYHVAGRERRMAFGADPAVNLARARQLLEGVRGAASPGRRIRKEPPRSGTR